MTTFDDRDKSFENKFAHDEEIAFKIVARRNKLMGLWAAEKLGKKRADADSYAQTVVLAGVEDSDAIAPLILKDFQKAGVSLSAKDVQREMEKLLIEARHQIMGQK